MLQKLYSEYQESRKAHKDEDEGEIAYNMVETEAFNYLIYFIRNEMLPSKKIFPVVILTCKIEFVHAKGFTIKETTKKHIRRKIESEVGNIIHFYKNKQGKLLAVPDSVTMQENENLKNELSMIKSKTNDMKGIIHQASSYIHSSIQENCMASPRPYHPSDITKESINLPHLLQDLLTGILTGEPEKQCLS